MVMVAARARGARSGGGGGNAKATGSAAAQCWRHHERAQEFLLSKRVTGALVLKAADGVAAATPGSVPEPDQEASGLIALVRHYPDVSNKLRVLWNSEEQFVVQALVHAVSHASDLGNEIAALLPHMPRYVADVTATNNEGKFDKDSSSSRAPARTPPTSRSPLFERELPGAGFPSVLPSSH